MGAKNEPQESVKVLTEAKIQERLYGQYRKAPRKETASNAPEATVWTGAEILAQELKGLRQELIALRREREVLVEELAKRKHRQDLQTQVSFKRFSESRGWLPLVASIAVVISLGVVKYPLGIRLLQASPIVSAEPTPYTVQVVVYRTRPQAQVAIQRLKEWGYPAFMTESSWKNGKPQYRVYLGQFVTREEANQERLRLKNDPRFLTYSDAFVQIW